jgi:hypothetical protein
MGDSETIDFGYVGYGHISGISSTTAVLDLDLDYNGHKFEGRGLSETLENAGDI